MKSILSRRSFISRTPLLVLASFVAVDFAARAAATDTKQYNLGADKIALQGHDPVAYIAQNKAAKGSKEFSATHAGVVYWFAAAANKALFEASPAKYLPTYGGWCATAMAKGEKVEIDPLNFKVTNGRLFLFYKGLWGNARKDWDKDEAIQTTKADTQWKKISGE